MRNGSKVTEFLQKDRDVGGAFGKGLSSGLGPGALEDEGVFVNARTTARGVGDDGIDIGRESGEILYGKFLSGGKFTDMPAEGAATALGFGDDDFDTVDT